MQCLRCSRGLANLNNPSQLIRIAQQVPSIASKRTFTSLVPRRPTIFPSFSPIQGTFTADASESAASALDLISKTAITSHPALGSTQIRCGPRNTFSPSHFVRKRRHGFLSRVKTRKGRATLQRRRTKKRSTLSH